VVLVLIPGGSFRMGAQREDESAPNFDRLARSDDGPVHEVTVAPFFLAKHELTQAQWMRLDGGTNPSYFCFGLVVNGQPVTKRHPVEQVEWSEGQRVLHRAGLQYPTEEQWEYATRAGSDAPWSFGSRGVELQRFANFADMSSRHVLVQVTNLDDGQSFTAPVGSYDANAFGLHDVHGNVFEWCSDLLLPGYREPGPPPQPVTEAASQDPRRRAVRGGAWASSPDRVRSAYREFVRLDPFSQPSQGQHHSCSVNWPAPSWSSSWWHCMPPPPPHKTRRPSRNGRRPPSPRSRSTSWPVSRTCRDMPASRPSTRWPTTRRRRHC
jgi:formylglycine-generating enzyme required for sulfatase activity